MAEYKMRGENGDPLHDLAEVCDYNESLIIDSVNRDRAQKAAERDQRRNSKRGRSRS